jgi:hypothetical protein
MQPRCRMFMSPLTSSYPGPEALYDYELFAVINHEGQIDKGHYMSFARFQDTVRVLHLIPPPATD